MLTQKTPNNNNKKKKKKKKKIKKQKKFPKPKISNTYAKKFKCF